MKNILTTLIIFIMLSIFSSCSMKENNTESTQESVEIENVAPQAIINHLPERDNNENQQLCSETPTELPQDFVGNLVSGSGGYIIEFNGLYYFANNYDQNKLYQMDTNFENIQKLSDNSNIDHRLYIQCYGNQLYYLQNSKSEMDDDPWICTLYSYDLENHYETKVLEENVCNYIIDGNWIYFSTLDTKKVYRTYFDGSNIQLLNDGDPYLSVSLQVLNNQLYFGWDEAIIQLDLDGSFLQSWCAYPYVFQLYNQGLFFINFRSMSLERIDISKKDILSDSITLVDSDVLTFTISESIIYYGTIDKKIFKTDLDGNYREFITDGSNPIVINDHIFYYSLEGYMNNIPKI